MRAQNLLRDGEAKTARARLDELVAVAPNCADAWSLLGTACLACGLPTAAAQALGRAVALAPHHVGLINNYGHALLRCGEHDKALAALKSALEREPGHAGAHQNLGATLLALGHHDDALEHAQTATDLEPNRAAAWHDLGLTLLDHVRLEDAARALRQALRLRPAWPAAATSLLYLSTLLPGQDARATAEEHRRVMAGVFPPATPEATPAGAERERRLRVGYVSADFRAHAVAYFLQPLLDHHDREQFEVFCYASVANPDAHTAAMRAAVEHWRDIVALDDGAAAAQVRADRIDVLVDLSGHTEGNRLGLFARRPAPVQLSWLGYPNTTGLVAMDYRIVARFPARHPESLAGTEECLPLDPVFACFRPSPNAGPVTPAPCRERGCVTLGSFHKLEKLNPAVIALWAAVLRARPALRLRLVRDQLDDWHRDRLARAFAAGGVGRGQLEFRRFDPARHRFQDQFADIDLMLDVFPWSGHTLACHALWQGVPVITTAGSTHAANLAAGVLHAVGVPELVAKDPAAFVDLALELTDAPGRLVAYRGSLRGRFEDSALRDEAGFARRFEALLASVVA